MAETTSSLLSLRTFYNDMESRQTADINQGFGVVKGDSTAFRAKFEAARTNITSNLAHRLRKDINNNHFAAVGNDRIRRPDMRNPHRLTDRNDAGVRPKLIVNTKRETKRREMVEKQVADLAKENEHCRGKEKYLKIYILGQGRQLRMDFDKICKRIPTEQQMKDLYGPEPIVYGLDTCSVYRQLLKAKDDNSEDLNARPRVAGLYNTGTNALSRTFEDNFGVIPWRFSRTPWDVPVSETSTTTELLDRLFLTFVPFAPISGANTSQPKIDLSTELLQKTTRTKHWSCPLFSSGYVRFFVRESSTYD